MFIRVIGYMSEGAEGRLIWPEPKNPVCYV